MLFRDPYLKFSFQLFVLISQIENYNNYFVSIINKLLFLFNFLFALDKGLFNLGFKFSLSVKSQKNWMKIPRTCFEEKK